MAVFEKQKQSCLSQVDLSKKGSIDEPIVELIEFINAKENYFTTSSCSGRISIFSELADQRKKHCEWLYVSHNAAREEDILNSLNGCQGSATFKFEPFVLHVQCKDLHKGQQMLKAALISGFKNSGIVLGRKGNVIVAVRSTQSLEVPLLHEGELMVSEKYIRFLVNIANKKLEENQTRINRFFVNLKDVLDGTCKSEDGTCQDSDKGVKDSGRRGRDKHNSHVPEEISSQKLESMDPKTCEDDFIDCLVSFYEGVS